MLSLAKASVHKSFIQFEYNAAAHGARALHEQEIRKYGPHAFLRPSVAKRENNDGVDTSGSMLNIKSGGGS